MDLALALILLAAVFAILGYPLYKAAPRAAPAGDSPLPDLLAQRDGLYATLRDLDLDHELGKLDDADYRSRREQYLARAANVLFEIDAARKEPAISDARDQEIEREIQALRRSMAESRAGEGAACSGCGHPYEPAARFCSNCGQALS